MADERPKLYNPLAIESIAESLVRKIEETPAVSLPPNQPFSGAGVYSIYYRGGFSAYAQLSGANQTAWTTPIYIGKAIPKGGRIGISDGASSQGLYDRLREHADSITAASNLELDDFACRYLAIEHLFISLAEHTLINRYKPVWNYFGGFGNHDPGGGRYAQKRSAWDTLHPGRAWASRLQDNPHDASYWLARFQEHILKAEQGEIQTVIPDDSASSEDEDGG
ncbi:MAG TPA: Eco29kI family restriction endonuclease [Ktedonobacterales bacterium]|nr:Eco29kI family restriction endonuclease [Ktedonobacterales bacterium]